MQSNKQSFTFGPDNESRKVGAFWKAIFPFLTILIGFEVPWFRLPYLVQPGPHSLIFMPQQEDLLKTEVHFL